VCVCVCVRVRGDWKEVEAREASGDGGATVRWVNYFLSDLPLPTNYSWLIIYVITLREN